jgi:ribosomal-protein-alanine N-acetyltransferase
VIRPLVPEDAEALAALYAANRERLAPYEPERDDAFFTRRSSRRGSSASRTASRSSTATRWRGRSAS